MMRIAGLRLAERYTRPGAAITRLSLRAHAVARYPYFEGTAGVFIDLQPIDNYNLFVIKGCKYV